MKRKLRVLFVAGFAPIGGKIWGGIMAEATNLVGSEITRVVDFHLLDSTMRSVPPPSLAIRSIDALRRIARFLCMLPRADVAILYISDGTSLLEKGLMVGLARLCNKGVVARFSSGYLPAQCMHNWLLRFWLRLTVRLSDAVACQSNGWKTVYQAYAGKSTSLVVIPNGVVMPKLSWTADKATAKKIVYVGWINKRKGVFDLIAAVGILAARHKEVSLSLAGGGTAAEALASHIAACGLAHRIHLLGWVPREQIAEILASGHVFVLPSYGEGLPNSLLEAMSVGVPVIATRVGAVAEVVQDGESGLLIEPGDVTGLAASIDALFADRDWADRLGAAGRKVVSERYCMERVSILWGRILAEVAARRGKLGPSEVVFAWLNKPQSSQES